MYSDNDLPDIVMVLEHYGAVVRRTTGQLISSVRSTMTPTLVHSFNTRENIFNCFACGMQGNSLQIIAQARKGGYT
jgi:hypothetical protein